MNTNHSTWQAWNPAVATNMFKLRQMSQYFSEQSSLAKMAHCGFLSCVLPRTDIAKLRLPNWNQDWQNKASTDYTMVTTQNCELTTSALKNVFGCAWSMSFPMHISPTVPRMLIETKRTSWIESYA